MNRNFMESEMKKACIFQPHPDADFGNIWAA